MKDLPSSVINSPFKTPPAEGEAVAIAPGVLWMRLPLPMKLDHVNVYALDDGDSWTVIDTGMNSRRGRAIWQKLMQGPLAGKPIARVIVTHHHPDHIGMAGWFQSDHGAELWTTRTAWLYARMLSLDVQATPAEETRAFWRSGGMDKAVYDKRLTERPYNFSDTVAPLPLGFTRIQQGDVLRIGGRSWDVHIGNGHAPEHATFWSRDDNLVIGGDQILATISPNIGVYATEPDADPVADWMEACSRLIPHANDQQLVLPGHKLPFTGLPRRLQQMIDNHHNALPRLRQFIQEPHTAAECFTTLFKRKIGEAEYGLALVESMAHLNHLFHLGQADRTMREDGAWLWTRKG